MRYRADDNGPFKEFDLFEWLCDSCNVQELREHTRQTIKEQLMTVRDVLDRTIEKIEQEQAKEAG